MPKTWRQYATDRRRERLDVLFTAGVVITLGGLALLSLALGAR